MSTGAYLDASALPGERNGPVFANPWQAQIFALVVGLHQRGCFSWGEWTETLSAEIAAARENDSIDSKKEEADPGDSYYRMWVITLERILTSKTIVYSDDIQNRVSAWRNAYLNTPHGNPVTLSMTEN